ncbi:MAG: hypothetical protein OEW09_01510 [Anaerolineae bacterium]|nr:hypothetical protein [Anaerolineae bacterium]
MRHRRSDDTSRGQSSIQKDIEPSCVSVADFGTAISQLCRDTDPAREAYPNFSASDAYLSFSVSDAHPSFSVSDAHPSFSVSDAYPSFSARDAYPYRRHNCPDFHSGRDSNDDGDP